MDFGSGECSSRVWINGFLLGVSAACPRSRLATARAGYREQCGAFFSYTAACPFCFCELKLYMTLTRLPSHHTPELEQTSSLKELIVPSQVVCYNNRKQNRYVCVCVWGYIIVPILWMGKLVLFMKAGRKVEIVAG